MYRHCGGLCIISRILCRHRVASTTSESRTFFSVERGPSLGDATRLLFTVPAAAAAVDLVTRRVVSVAMIGPYNAMRTFSLFAHACLFLRAVETSLEVLRPLTTTINYRVVFYLFRSSKTTKFLPLQKYRAPTLSLVHRTQLPKRSPDVAEGPRDA